LLEWSQPERKRAARLRVGRDVEKQQAPSLFLRMPLVRGSRANQSLIGTNESGDKSTKAEAELTELILTLDTDFHTRLRRYARALARLLVHAAS